MLPIVIGIGVAALFIAGCSSCEESNPDPSPNPRSPSPPPSGLPPPYRFDISDRYDTGRRASVLQGMALRLLREGVPVAQLDRGNALYFPWESNFAGYTADLIGAGDFAVTDIEVILGIYQAGQSLTSSSNIQSLFQEMIRDPENRLRIAVQLMMAPDRSEGTMAEAGRILQNLLELAPNDTDSLRELGHWHRLSGNRVEALRQYVLADESTSIIPGDTPTWGLILEMNESGEGSQAEHVLNQMRDANPSHVYVRYYLGRWQSLQDRRSEAIASYESVLAMEALHSENVVIDHSRRRLIDLLIQDQRYREADELFRQFDETMLTTEDLHLRARVRDMANREEP